MSCRILDWIQRKHAHRRIGIHGLVELPDAVYLCAQLNLGGQAEAWAGLQDVQRHWVQKPESLCRIFD